eukprot:768069-Hanusia_phi.AAC.5
MLVISSSCSPGHPPPPPAEQLRHLREGGERRVDIVVGGKGRRDFDEGLQEDEGRREGGRQGTMLMRTRGWKRTKWRRLKLRKLTTRRRRRRRRRGRRILRYDPYLGVQTCRKLERLPLRGPGDYLGERRLREEMPAPS